MNACLMCGCLLERTKEQVIALGQFCTLDCQTWHDAWVQFPDEARPPKIAYYLKRKYHVDEKFVHDVQ